MNGYHIYLDSSVPNAHLDSRWAERQALTEKFWREILPGFEVYVSDVMAAELMLTPDPERRRKLLDLIRPFPFLRMTPEAEELAEAFLEDGLIPATYREDSRHLALAIVEGMDILVSWNFEHMVNFHTKRLLPMLSAKRGYFKQLLILSPQEFWRS